MIDAIIYILAAFGALSITSLIWLSWGVARKDEEEFDLYGENENQREQEQSE